MYTIGNHLIVGVQSYELTPLERRLWAAIKPSGVILFRRNFSDLSLIPNSNWSSELSSLVDELRSLTERSDLVVSIDHEGGRVHRLVEPITHFPPAKNWLDLSYQVGAAMGAELASLGINLNFAPCFDILVEEKNKVIGDRALGEDAESVATHGLQFLMGLERYGVTGCAKHFPGHGGTVHDSHEQLPEVLTSLKLLKERELYPFQRYIETGRELIMTAHVLFSSIDSEFPATLSKRIIGELLRGELGYTGAIITDALDMGALAAMRIEEVSRRFFEIGGDLLCICQDKKSTPIEVADYLCKQLDVRSLDATLENSRERVQRLKNRISHTWQGRSTVPPDLTSHRELDLALRARETQSGVV